MFISAAYAECLHISDVPGLQISGFGRAGLDPFGLRAGRAFLHRASGFFSGFLKTLNTALFIYRETSINE